MQLAWGNCVDIRRHGQFGRAMLTVVLGFSLWTTRTFADVTVKGATEVAAYQDTTATSVLTPGIGLTIDSPTSGLSVGGKYLVDMVSAASPDIVSTASPRWTELRQAGSLGGKYKPGNVGLAVSGSVSHTPDYLSLSGGGSMLFDLDEKNLTLIAGYNFGRDTIGRTGTPFSVFSNELDSHSFSVGVVRLLSPKALLSLSGDFIHESGDQSKPYRYIPLFTADSAKLVTRGASAFDVSRLRISARPREQLPLSRERGALTTRLIAKAGSGTLRLEERGYVDSWQQLASTTDFRYLFDASDRFIIGPHVRFHVQNGVNFWQRAYVANGIGDIPALRTGDRELGPLTNVTGGMSFRWSLGPSAEKDKFVFFGSADSVWTAFSDAIYIRNRGAILVVSGLEASF